MKIALKSNANGMFVCADDSVRGLASPERPLLANRPSAGAWETFELMVESSIGVWVPFNPAPPSVPTPMPPTAWKACTPAAGAPVVQCVSDAIAPQSHTPEGAFEVTKRVAWLLRAQGYGLLRKDGGENIVTWNGVSCSAGRVCMTDGHVFKILTDVPTTNGPTWTDNGFVDKSFYVPAMDPDV